MVAQRSHGHHVRSHASTVVILSVLIAVILVVAAALARSAV
jgi:hypothetical protein